MLSNSGIAVFSFANKVVKVQLQKVFRSLYGAPRTRCNILHSIMSLITVCRISNSQLGLS